MTVELSETLKLAVPMALTQLGQIAMMTTDLAFIGRLGNEAVAAAALAGTVYFISFTIGMGLVSAVAPLAAQAFGARDPHRVRRSLRTGLWAALLISLPIMLFSLYGEQILLALGQAPATAHLAQQYLFGLVWGVTPALWFMAIRGFMGAVNRPQPALWITLGRDPGQCVAGLSPDLRRMGPAAAGIVRRRACHHDRQFRHCCWRASGLPRAAAHSGNIACSDTSGASTGRLMRQLVAIGAPISLSFMMEYGLFSAAALLMGLISTTALAAHQVALQVTAILFMVPYRHLDGGHRAGRARGRPPRSERGQARRAWLRSCSESCWSPASRSP